MNNQPNATATATARGGVSGAVLLTIVFFIAKVTGYINWDWIWVFAPLWISFGMFVVFVLIIMGLALFIAWADEPRYKRRK